jgi:ribosomal protein S18 acetylase RimI-like enzyme
MHRPVNDLGVSDVREATRRDLRATARLHRRCLPDGFFARLGHGFLRRYHASFLRSPQAVALVVTADGEAAAFLVGTLRNRAHYRWVLQRQAVALAGRLVLALGARPRMAWLFVRTRIRRYVQWVVRYPFRRFRSGTRGSAAPAARDASPVDAVAATPTAPEAAASAGELAAKPVAVLTHVAVDESLRGRGAGRLLVETFVERAREAGAVEARLVTDVEGGASAFYEKLGWLAVGERGGSNGDGVREYRLPLRGTA